MFYKPLEQVDLADLEALLENQVREGISLDYKEALPNFGNNDEKKEFLSDVIAPASSEGGTIIFGIEDARDVNGKATGEPGEIKGVEIANRDAFTLQLENMFRDSIAPRLPNPDFAFVDLPNDKCVFIIRVRKSWAAPHMLTFKTKSPFFARNNGGTYRMDVNQIRNAFLLSDAAEEKLRRFREERVERIATLKTPISMVLGPKLILHTLPLSATQMTQQVNPKDLEKYRELFYNALLRSQQMSNRFNFDGFIAYGLAPYAETQPSFDCYMQGFRNGSFEYVSSKIAMEMTEEKLLWSIEFEKQTLHALEQHLALLGRIGVGLPVFAALSLTGVRDYKLTASNSSQYLLRGVERLVNIDQDILITPEILISESDSDLPTLMRSAFDAVWQAAGHRESLNYDEQGIWRENLR